MPGFIPGVYDPASYGQRVSEVAELSQLRQLAANLSVPQVVPDNHRIYYPHVWVDLLGSMPREQVILAFETAVGTAMSRLSHRPTAVGLIMIDLATKSFGAFLRCLRTPLATREDWQLPLSLLLQLNLQMKLAEFKQEEVFEYKRRIDANPQIVDLGKAAGVFKTSK